MISRRFLSFSSLSLISRQPFLTGSSSSSATTISSNQQHCHNLTCFLLQQTRGSSSSTTTNTKSETDESEENSEMMKRRTRFVEIIRPEDIIVELISTSFNSSTSTNFSQQQQSESIQTSTIFTYSAATSTFVESIDHHAPNNSSTTNHQSNENTNHRQASSASSSTSHQDNHKKPTSHHHNQNHHNNNLHQFEEITSVDTFARGKVLNFLQRMDPGANLKGKNTHLFSHKEEREIQEDGSEIILVKCTLRIVLPYPHRQAMAQGTAQNEKDAEHLAVMHAQRIIDALGVPLFSLPSMQKRHAEAARAQGRWAPMPGDGVKPQGTPLPPPLKMVSLSHEAATNSKGSSNSANANKHDRQREDEDREAAPPPPSKTAAPKSAPAPSAENSDDSKVTNEDRNSKKESESTTPSSNKKEEDDDANKSATLEQQTPENNIAAPEQKSAEQSPSSSQQQATSPIESTSEPTSTNTTTTTSAAADPTTAVPEGATVIQQLYYLSPWVFAAAHRPPPLAANIRDATEGAVFQLVNLVSTRCSGSKYGISLPCIFDKTSLDRITDAIQSTDKSRHVVKEMKLAQMLVPGTSQRMHVAEFVLDKTRNIVARGKSTDGPSAMHLCGMHAELLMDYYSIPVYPNDKAKQSEHALNALENGRWAPGFDFDLLPKELQETIIVSSSSSSSVSDVEIKTDFNSIMKFVSGIRGPPVAPLASSSSSPSDSTLTIEDDVPPPLPLKALSGGFGDAEGLPALGRAHYRSVPERMVMLHNELANQVNEMQECNPHPSMAREAMRAMRVFQRDRGSFYRSHYVITQMGEQYKATMVLPLIEKLGVRGGVGVGRSPQHAMEVCALHALDVLNWLNIPVYGNDAEKQRKLADSRKAMRLSYFYHPDDKNAFADEINISKNDDEISNNTQQLDQQESEMKSGAKDQPLRNRQNKFFFEKPPPGLLLLESLGPSRALAPDSLIKYMQGLNVLDAFDVIKNMSDTDIIEKGNKDKNLVLMYLARTKQQATPYVLQLGMQKNAFHMHCAAALEVSVYITPSACSDAYALIMSGSSNNNNNSNSNPTPATSPATDNEELGKKMIEENNEKYRARSWIALGASLKRKDADRCLFIHIAAALRTFGIVLEKEETYAAAERKRIKLGGMTQQQLQQVQQQNQMSKKEKKRLRQKEEEEKKLAKEKEDASAKSKSSEVTNNSTTAATDAVESGAKGDPVNVEEPAITDSKEAAESAKEEESKVEQQNPSTETTTTTPPPTAVTTFREQFSHIEVPRPLMHRLLDDMLKKDLRDKSARAVKAKIISNHRSTLF